MGYGLFSRMAFTCARRTWCYQRTRSCTGVLIRVNVAVFIAMAPGCSDSPLAPIVESKPTISFEPTAVMEIQAMVREHELDWREVAIYLATDDQPPHRSTLKMAFVRRDQFSVDSHVFAEFDGIPVVMPKDQVSSFQNVRITLGERNGVRGLVIENVTH